MSSSYSFLLFADGRNFSVFHPHPAHSSPSSDRSIDWLKTHPKGVGEILWRLTEEKGKGRRRSRCLRLCVSRRAQVTSWGSTAYRRPSLGLVKRSSSSRFPFMSLVLYPSATDFSFTSWSRLFPDIHSDY